MSVRKFFDDVQMATESGGRQLDKDGKPLVGRYRNGTTPPPEKRAYGAGQMQIGTAKGAAKRAGIQWDEKRFMNDREYNLTLADKHMEYLTTRYGDRTLARAAYHSGEGTVDKAIARYGRDGFAKGLGPEGRKYIQMGTGSSGGTRPRNDVLASVEAAIPAEVKASGGVTQNNSAIFGSDKKLDEGFKAARQEQTKGLAVLDVLDQATQVAHTTQNAAMVRQVEDTRAINSSIIEGGQELTRRVQPVFQARTRIADQLDKLAGMNPLERAFRGVFDLNYDKKYLEGQLKDYDTTLQARAADFDYLNRLGQTGMQEINRRFGLDTGLTDLAVAQGKEDLQLTNLRLQQLNGVLEMDVKEIGTQATLIAAKDNAVKDMLGRIDTPTMTDLHAQAVKNGGMVEFNGAQISATQLRDSIRVSAQQEMQMESMALSLESGRMGLYEKQSDQLIQTMTRDQVDSAIAAGGMYKGHQLPIDQLQAASARHTQYAQMQAQTIADTMPEKAALGAAAQSLNLMAGLWNRGAALMGQNFDPQSEGALQEGSRLIHELRDAIKSGASPETISILAKKSAAHAASYREQIDGAILRNAGGDKKAAAGMSAFVYGAPLDSSAAAEFLTHYAVRGQMPFGATATPEAKAIFAEIQTEVAAIKAKTPNITTERLQMAVAQKLSTVAGRVAAGKRFNDVEARLPSLAKQVGHPFGKFSQSAWTQINANAEVMAAQQVAGEVQATPQEVLTMYRNGRALSTRPEDQAKFERWKKAQGSWNSFTQQAVLDGVDDQPKLVAGRRNSTLLQEFLTDDKLLEHVNQQASATKQGSFADYLIAPFIPGTVETAITSYRQGLAAQRATADQANLSRSRDMQRAYGNPLMRARVILGSISGVGTEGREALMPAIKQILGADSAIGVAKMTGQDLLVGESRMAASREAAVIEGLSRMKFDDPATEAYRKAAIRGWKEASASSDDFVSNFLTGISPGAQ